MATFYLDYENGNDSNDGSTWALAWKTITSGATAARTAPGDTIRIAKSPAPSSIGNATWTNLSKIVTLATAQNATIGLCETAWTSGGGDVTTPSTTSTNKQGTVASSFTFDSTPQASILQVYKATGTLNLSSYQKISFWFRNSSAVIANNFKICLCSDTAGATPVDTFLIPAIPSYNQYLPLTLSRVGAGNLGASIQSIALYTDSVAPAASITIYLDDFIACTTNGLNLQSLISKNSAEQGGTEHWFGIQSIDGTTVNLDAHTNCAAQATELRGYRGTTETVTTYKRETIKTDVVSSSTTTVHGINESGNAGSLISYKGGYDTGTSLQTGVTIFDGLNGYGYGIAISSKNYVAFDRLGMYRYSRGLYDASGNYCEITNCFAGNCSYGITLNGSSDCTITSVICNNNWYRGVELTSISSRNIVTGVVINNNNDAGLQISQSFRNTVSVTQADNNYNHGVNLSTAINNTIQEITNADYNRTAGIYISSSSRNTIISASCALNSNTGVYITGASNNIFKSLSTSGNDNYGVYYDSDNYFFNSTLSESNEVGASVAGSNSRLFSNNHDNTAGNNWIFTDGGEINSQNTDRHTASGIAWTLTPAAARISTYPLDFKVAKIACAANALVTVKIWMIKGHATNVAGKLVCRGGQLAGVPSDVTATKADDTNWEELTITFTPTEAGVIEIEAWVYYVAGVSTVTVDDMTISQA